MKLTYIPVQEPDGSWKMVTRLDENQRRDADKARRRILNIKKDDNPWWAINPDHFGQKLSRFEKLLKDDQMTWLNTMVFPMNETAGENTGARTAAGIRITHNHLGYPTRASSST